MNNNDGAISFKALLETKDFEQGRFKIESQLKNLTALAEQEANKFDSVFKRAGTAVAAYFTFDAAKNMIGDIVKVRGEFQQLEIAFTTMLGSKAKADALMQQSVEFAAKTPFGLEATASATKQLLAYGESADTVIGTLRKLGDISAALKIPLGDLAYLYGTTMTQGRLYTQDFNQFVGRGIPLIEELSEQFGVAKEDVKGLVEAGKVGFPQIQLAIENMTKEGSTFGGLMEEQSKSIPGQIEQLKDAWAQMLNEIGKSNEGVINDAIGGLANLVANYEQVGKILVGLIATYGTYRAALILTDVMEKIIASSKAASVYLEMAAGLGQVTIAHRARAVAMGIEAAAQRALNAVMSDNPYVLLATAVVGLTALIWSLHDSTTAQEHAQEQLNKKLAESKQQKDQYNQSIKSLISTIQSETASLLEQLRAYDELIKKSAEFAKYSRFDIAKMPQSQITDILEIEDIKNINKELEEAQKLLKDFEKTKNIIGGDISGGSSEDILGYDLTQTVKDLGLVRDSWKVTYDEIAAALNGRIQQLEHEKQLIAEAAEEQRVATLPIQEQIKYHQQNIEKLEVQKNQLQTALLLSEQTGRSFGNWQTAIDNISLQNVINQIASAQGMINSLGAGTIGNSLNDLDKQSKQLQDDWNALSEAERKLQRASFQSRKDDLDRQRQAGQLKTNVKSGSGGSNSKRSGGRKEEKFLEGSIAYYDKEIQKLEEKLKRLPSDNVQQIQSLNAQLIQLTEAREAAQKAIAIRTWQETLDEKSKLYADYEALLSNADTTSGASAIDVMALENAKKAFAGLLEGGQNYEQFLRNQLEPLTQKVIGNEATQEELSRYIILTKELKTVTGELSPMERFNLKLIDIKENAGSSADVIKSLSKELDLLNDVSDNDKGTLWREQSKALSQALKEANKQAADDLRQYLEQVEGSKKQELAIVKKYEGLIAQAEKEGANTEVIQKAYNEEMAQNYAANLEAYKEMNALMGAEDLKRLKEHEAAIKKLIQNLIDAGYGSSEVVKNLQKSLIDNTNKQSQIVANNINLWASAIGQAGQELSQLEGTLGNIGQLFASAAQSANQFAQQYNTIQSNGGKNNAQSYAAAANAGVNLIGMVIGAAQKRKAAKKQAKYDATQAQLDLNKALVEEIRLRTELNENAYVTDYYGRITDAMQAMQTASGKAMDAMIKLNEVGEAKNGTKNKIDWGNVGAGAGSGATIGATIGAAVGGGVLSIPAAAVGAIIGTIAGGLVGLFAGMKKDARYSGLFEVYPELISQSGEFNQTLAETLIANGQLTDETAQYLQQLIDMNEEWKAAKEQIASIVEDLTGQMGGQLRDALVGAFEDGTDAAYAFSKVVEDTLQNALEQLIYSKVFGQLFDTLGADLENALMYYGTTNDLAGVYDAMAKFMGNSQEAIDIFNKVMEAAQEYGKNYGFDLWDNENDRANGMSGQIKSLTEETGNVLAGNITQIRIQQAEHGAIFRDQLFALANISANSNYLVKIEAHLSRMSGNSSSADYRAQGVEL